jgi:predicted TIM-barrel fold metal-dependent hydrolase
MWINLGGGKSPIRNTDSIKLISEGRILCTISDYDPFRGLTHIPEDLHQIEEQGFVGYKIWYGPWYRRLEEDEKGFRYVDDPENDPMFAKMEELGILAASIHIADPNGPINNRTKWCADPVEYWKEINAFHNVLKKYPDLKVVAAHASWLICQDAQIDYLRYLLSSYPNFNIDLAATFQYYNLVSHENLREFMIEYADRILFGTDAGTWNTAEQTKSKAEAYNRAFRILETDQTVEGSFFSNKPIKGLNLPKEVLEKIYYKNAMRIYPKVACSMHALNYK